MQKEEVQAKVIDALRALNFLEEEDMKPESKLVDDLGFDSLDKIEGIMEVEKAFGMTIPDEEIESAETVGDIINYVCDKLGIVS